MLERGFGLEVQMVSEDVVVLETCCRTAPEALEAMLIYFLNVKGRMAYERARGQAEGSSQDDRPKSPSTIYELLQCTQNEIEEIVAELGEGGVQTVKRQLADLKERETCLEAVLARAHPSGLKGGSQLNAEPRQRIEGSGIHDLAVTNRNQGVEIRSEPRASRQSPRHW